MTPHEIKAFSETLTYLARLVVDIRTDQKLFQQSALRILDAQGAVLIKIAAPAETRGRKHVPISKVRERQKYKIRKLEKELKLLHELLDQQSTTI